MSPIVRPHFTCTFSPKCKNKEAFNYVTPSVTRWGNVSTRSRSVCAACAERIKREYPGVVVKG